MRPQASPLASLLPGAPLFHGHYGQENYSNEAENSAIPAAANATQAGKKQQNKRELRISAPSNGQPVN